MPAERLSASLSLPDVHGQALVFQFVKASRVELASWNLEDGNFMFQAA